MKGRLEHEIRINKNIDSILKSQDEILTDYYYNLQVSKEATTCLEYIRKIRGFLDYTNKKVNEITDTDIGRYFMHINYIKDNKGNTHAATFAYKKSIWSALNQFFSYTYRKGITSCNPMEGIQRPNNKDHVIRRHLNVDDLNNILAAVKSGAGNRKAKSRQKLWKERDLLIMFLFMNTGMRKTALSEINVSDISFDNKTLIVTDKRNKTQIYTITVEMANAINIWLVKREVILAGQNEDALFISAKKQRISERAVYDLVRKYSEEGLGYAISPHKLRAAFVTLYYEASGNDIKATCEAVGHASIATTSLYIVKDNNSRKEAQEMMSKILVI